MTTKNDLHLCCDITPGIRKVRSTVTKINIVHFKLDKTLNENMSSPLENIKILDNHGSENEAKQVLEEGKSVAVGERNYRNLCPLALTSPDVDRSNFAGWRTMQKSAPFSRRIL